MKTFQRYNGNYANCLNSLTKNKQRIATPAEAMDERIRQGEGSDICTRGAWYNASFSEVDGRILATRGEFNPLINYAQEAVNAMRTGEFYLNDKILINGKPAVNVLNEIAEKDAKKLVHKRRVLDLAQEKTHDVSTDCFADDDTIVFLAEGKERANKYGLFLRNSKYEIKYSKVYMQDLIGKNKTRGFWLCRLAGNGRSDFGGSHRDLGDYDCSLLGVQSESAEKTPKIVLACSQRQIKNELKRLSRLESEIAKSRNFLESLKEK